MELGVMPFTEKLALCLVNRWESIFNGGLKPD
jgi:hypothetical protein